jgi:hypothetical protein
MGFQQHWPRLVDSAKEQQTTETLPLTRRVVYAHGVSLSVAIKIAELTERAESHRRLGDDVVFLGLRDDLLTVSPPVGADPSTRFARSLGMTVGTLRSLR